MTQADVALKLIASRESLGHKYPPLPPFPKPEAEGGCGVIGIAASEKLPGRHLLQALRQMRNRGNGKGGGIAAVGLVPEQLGVTQEILERDYLLSIAYLDTSARAEVERNYIAPTFEIDHTRMVPHVDDYRRLPGLEAPPPEVHQYFVRVRPAVLEEFTQHNGLDLGHGSPARVVVAEDEIVYQNAYRLNRAFYAATGDKRAFVLSHGKNTLVLKMVGYGDDVIRYYQLEDLRAHVWIGHHRYPTKGKLWHPGGAHPFVGLHEALVHNGDFANYASLCDYLAQRHIHPLFLTDTEVSVLVFDLLHRLYSYPLEYVIEALAPTTEHDFALLPMEKQEIYRMLQAVHIHGSPDGPWFFLIAQSAPTEQAFRLIGITDTSMLRPQVFALQEGAAAIGFAASEKQAIDGALESLAREDPRFWARADRYWNARGGSHTDGGAFIFEVRTNGAGPELTCMDKFGRPICVNPTQRAYPATDAARLRPRLAPESLKGGTTDEIFQNVVAQMPAWDYKDVAEFLDALVTRTECDSKPGWAIDVLTRLIDWRYSTGALRRSRLLALFDGALMRVIEFIRRASPEGFAYAAAGEPRPLPTRTAETIVVAAGGFQAQGSSSLALELVHLYRQGWRQFIVVQARGHRFVANGLGPSSHGVRIDMYGSPGDYLASGIEGAEVFVHGSAQDQLAQIMKDGLLVVYGDVGQTFMYGAKGGKAFVLGNAAGRPLINAVGRPRVIINGTCLDYLAESFMAGDPIEGGGFVILNGITFDDDARIVELDTPYPGGNLFSLASGGAIYVRDPHQRLSGEQLNGGVFAEVDLRDWALIKPYLEENERLFGIPVARLLAVDGQPAPPERVYRKVVPGAERALQAEEAWVKMHA